MTVDEKEIRELRRLVAKYGLAGAGEACDVLGIQRAGLPPLRRRDDAFPKQLEQLRSGPVFVRAEVEQYSAARSAARAGRRS